MVRGLFWNVFKLGKNDFVYISYVERTISFLASRKVSDSFLQGRVCILNSHSMSNGKLAIALLEIGLS